jgi:protein disulfide-isomerase-like protein
MRPRPAALALALCLLLVGAARAAPPSDVVVLDSDNFDRVTKEGAWFILFYAPWCGHCKRMAPVWEQLATKMKGESVRVAKVDADGETEIGEKFSIQHYPTLKMFEAGKTTADYKGDTSLDSLHKFALDYQSKPKDKGTGRKFDFAAALQNVDTKSLAAPAIALVEKMAGDSLGLYTMIVFLSGFFSGVLAGVLFAVREKAHFD